MNELTSRNNLTFESFLAAIENMRTPLYYATTEYIEPGEVLRVPAGDCNPQYIVIHDDDFSEVSQQIPAAFKLTPLSEYRPTHDDIAAGLKRLSDRMLKESIEYGPRSAVRTRMF